MLATFSNEARIEQKLKALDCRLVHFATGPARGVVGRSRLTESLLGGRPLDQSIAEKLFAVLDEMAALKNELPVAPDWSDAERITALLQTRRKAQNLFQEEFQNAVSTIA